jgi:hypothetical protein
LPSLTSPALIDLYNLKKIVFTPFLLHSSAQASTAESFDKISREEKDHDINREYSRKSRGGHLAEL